jgi:hypothetical protein
MVRAAQVLGAQNGRHFDGPLDPVHAGPPDVGVGADWALVRAHHGDGGAAQAVLVQFRPHGLVMGGVALEQWDLDAVEAGLL